MKYKIEIEHKPLEKEFPYVAWAWYLMEDGEINDFAPAHSEDGKTSEEAENKLIKSLKKLSKKEKTIIKEIEI